MSRCVHSSSFECCTANPLSSFFLFFVSFVFAMKTCPVLWPEGEFAGLLLRETVLWYFEPLSYALGLVYSMALWPAMWWGLRMKWILETVVAGVAVGGYAAFLVFPFDLSDELAMCDTCHFARKLIGFAPFIGPPLILLLLKAVSSLTRMLLQCWRKRVIAAWAAWQGRMF